jgi:ubiquinone/menaquinone biosynthesis C-methylase UbiE
MLLGTMIAMQIRFIFRVVILFFLIVAGSITGQDHRHERYSPETYERPGRDAWQKPKEVVDALKLQPADVVADIGAGSGYFTRRLATRVPQGIVYAVDIDEKMLQHIHQYVEKQKQHNIVTVLSPVHDPMLAPGSTDVIFICNTYHHFTNRLDYNKRLARSLKKGGRLVIVDYYKKELPVGPPAAEKLGKEEVIQEISAASLKLEQQLTFLPHQYFLIFRK